MLLFLNSWDWLQSSCLLCNLRCCAIMPYVTSGSENDCTVQSNVQYTYFVNFVNNAQTKSNASLLVN